MLVVFMVMVILVILMLKFDDVHDGDLEVDLNQFIDLYVSLIPILRNLILHQD
jgi:hypothetical protein